MPTNEAGVVLAITKAVHRVYPQAWIFKVAGSPYQMVGVPDLLVCVEGLLFGIEVKFQRPGESRESTLGRTSPTQVAQIHRIRRAGGTADTVLSADEALTLIAQALEER